MENIHSNRSKQVMAYCVPYRNPSRMALEAVINSLRATSNNWAVQTTALLLEWL